MPKRNILLFLITYFILFSTFNCKSNENKETGKTVKLTGYISLVGSEPFSTPVLQTKDGSYYLPDNFKKDYLSYFGFNVEIEALLEIKNILLADQKTTIKEKHLKNVKIKKLNQKVNF